MEKIFRRGLIAFLIVISLFSASIVGATVKLYTATTTANKDKKNPFGTRSEGFNFLSWH